MVVVVFVVRVALVMVAVFAVVFVHAVLLLPPLLCLGMRVVAVSSFVRTM